MEVLPTVIVDRVDGSFLWWWDVIAFDSVVFAVKVGSAVFTLEVEGDLEEVVDEDLGEDLDKDLDEDVEEEVVVVVEVVEEVVVGSTFKVVELVVAGSDPVVSPSGVSSVAVCPWQTHCSQSVVAWPGQATGSNSTTGLSPNTSLCAMMSK